MNPYTTKGQARIQHHDIGAVLGMNSYLAGASLAALERQRGWQAEAEVNWLLKRNGVTPQAGASFLSLLRQTIGATLVRAGEHFVGAPQPGTLPGTVPARGMLGTAD
jgi:hypothetical protein